MGTFYVLEGTIKVRAGREVIEIVRDINARSGVDDPSASYTDNLDGTAEVEFDLGKECSYQTAAWFEAKAQELWPWVVEPVMLEVESDSEQHRLYIGPPDRQGETISAWALKDILGMLDELTLPDRVKLMETLRGGQHDHED